MTPWLAIVGIGEDGLDGAAPAGRRLIEQAEVLVGGARHLAMVPADHPAESLGWESPLENTVAAILERRGSRVCVLATGDPMWYGIGVILARAVPAGERVIVPAPSAFSLACARLGWPLAEIETLTLHGRPPALVESFVQPGARLLILSDGAETPGTVAELLRARGYGDSRLTVLEHMGGERERIWTGFARDWAASGVAPFNTLAVECLAGPDAALLPRVPGLPDEAEAVEAAVAGAIEGGIMTADLGGSSAADTWQAGSAVVERLSHASSDSLRRDGARQT